MRRRTLIFAGPLPGLLALGALAKHNSQVNSVSCGSAGNCNCAAGMPK
jgi:hypothetical protein